MIPPDQEIYEVEKRIAERRHRVEAVARQSGRAALKTLTSPWALLGASAIWGWVLGVPLLRDLGADFAPMSPGAALALLLLATSFFASHADRPRSAAIAAIAAGTIGVLTLAETLLGLSFGMNFAWLAAGGAELPGQMSIAACVTLLLLALVTPLARAPKILGASVNGLAAGVLGTVAFFA